MDNSNSISSQLNEQQVMMLRLFKNPMPDADFAQMRRLAVKLLSKQIDEIMDEWESDNSVKETDYEKLSQEHFRKGRPKN